MAKTYTLLVVDDEPHIIRILKNYLKLESYDVHTATNGLEAIQKVMEVNPRIVLLDIIMPGMGGIDALKEIKKIKPANKRTKDFFIIILSYMFTVKFLIPYRH